MGINSNGTTVIDQGIFENIGAITWDTTVKTSGFTAVSSNGYFCNTTSGAFTVTLPSSPSAGDVVAIADYANTFDTNNVTIARNGSNIQGEAEDFSASIEGLSITLIYVDGTQGWLSIDAAQANDITGPQFVTATGGTITTSGDFKIHTFTSPGTFCVSNGGNACGSTSVDYMVVAGGGGGGGGEGGGSGSAVSGSGAGAGGFRESSGAASGCYTASPLGSGVSALPVSATGYPITVGAGGAAGPQGPPGHTGLQGSNSIFSSITSTGGGYGARGNTTGGSGGSGGGVGGGCGTGTAGAGNTPPVSPPQGQPGATNPNNSSPYGASGGGGATAAGSQGSGGNAGNGGAGATSSINATPTGRAGGGGGGRGNPGSVSTAVDGGGYGGSTPNSNGVANKGGGGGGANAPTTTAGVGGSGIVIIRYKFQ
jgi:hypothetical protein|tara:strand:+ start:1318 stop:2595 length:1278 start_codon:yes stop_codon:yes gene_type:complete